MLIHGVVRKQAGSSSNTWTPSGQLLRYILSSQMYLSEHTNHDIHQNLLFQAIYKLFLGASNLHQ